MRSFFYVSFVALGCLISFSNWGCGPRLCQPDLQESCFCETKQGRRSCSKDGSQWSPCICSPSQEQTTALEPKESDEVRTVDGHFFHEPTYETTQDASSPEKQGHRDVDDRSETHLERTEQAIHSCGKDAFFWKGTCYTYTDFCTNQTGSTDFPVFSLEEQKAMARPYKLIFHPNNPKRPWFCTTQKGHFYLSDKGYGVCDNDRDHWINILAYRALTSTHQRIRENARCTLQKIEALVYIPDPAPHLRTSTKPSIESFKQAIPLIETMRNDGQSSPIERPLYTHEQGPLPTSEKTMGCKQDIECSIGLCYRGHCVRGRRFEASTINSFTKACIQGMDLNDNKIDDANERPTDTTIQPSELQSLLPFGYFLELHYGYFRKAYPLPDGRTVDAFVLHERSRLGPSGKASTLSLRCAEDPQGFQPDYWRMCQLQDDQTCADPNNPGQQKRGLSACWSPKVRRLLPSLFKCVVHDATRPKNSTQGFFHPDQYKTKNHPKGTYTRTRCSYNKTHLITDPNTPFFKRDIEFKCTSTNLPKPDSLKKEVGWACIAFQGYSHKHEHLAGCIDERAFQVCGSPGGASNTTYIHLEKKSYGMTRAKRTCSLTPPNQNIKQPHCYTSEQICTRGQWKPCDQCSNCPQENVTQKASCPQGKWPLTSCRTTRDPRELCNGKDDDCDGQIDEGIPHKTWYKDGDRDGFGHRAAKAFQACEYNKGGKQYICTQGDCSRLREYYANNKLDCCDKDAQVHPNQTRYFESPSACKTWDYNCDQRETAYGVPGRSYCQCSTQAEYVVSASQIIDLSHGHVPSHGRHIKTSKALGKYTYKNPRTCQLELQVPMRTHAADAKIFYGCYVQRRSHQSSPWRYAYSVGQCNGTGPHSKLIGNISTVYRPLETRSGGVKRTFTMWKKIQHTPSCYFHLDGSLPLKCGKKLYISGSAKKFESQRSWSVRTIDVFSMGSCPGPSSKDPNWKKGYGCSSTSSPLKYLRHFHIFMKSDFVFSSWVDTAPEIVRCR